MNLKKIYKKNPENLSGMNRVSEHGALKRVVLILFGLYSTVKAEFIPMEAPNKPCEKLRMWRAVTS